MKYLFFIGLVSMGIGSIMLLASYLFMAESHGVFRIFAYDRLSKTGKRVWQIGFVLVLVGGLFTFGLPALVSKDGTRDSESVAPQGRVYAQEARRETQEEAVQRGVETIDERIPGNNRKVGGL